MTSPGGVYVPIGLLLGCYAQRCSKDGGQNTVLRLAQVKPDFLLGGPILCGNMVCVKI